MKRKPLRNYRITISEQHLYSTVLTERNPENARLLALQMLEHWPEMFHGISHRVAVSSTTDLGHVEDDRAPIKKTARKEKS